MSSKKTVPRSTNDAYIQALMHRRSVWRLKRPSAIFIAVQYDPFNSRPTPSLFSSYTGDLLSRGRNYFDSKSSREASSLEEYTSDFEAFCDLSRSLFPISHVTYTLFHRGFEKTFWRDEEFNTKASYIINNSRNNRSNTCIFFLQVFYFLYYIK